MGLLLAAKLSLIILVAAFIVGSINLYNNYDQHNKIKDTVILNTNTDSVLNTTSSSDQNKLIEQEEDGEEEYEEYVVPTLKETMLQNDHLFNNTIQIIQKKYNVQNLTELDNLINQLGKIFNELEAETVSSYFKNFVNNPHKNKDLQQAFFGLYRDDFYCIKSDLYHLAHQEELYNNVTLFSDWADEYTREVLFGNFSRVVSEMYGWELPPEFLQKESFAPEINISQFYFNRPKFVSSFIIGRQLGCLFQGLNKIPSSGSFTRKEGLSRSYRKFLTQIDEINNNPNITKKYNDKCMKEFNFLPQTYNLNNVEECKKFFSYVESEAYQKKYKEEGFQFISKLGANVHQGRGIQVVTPAITEALQKKYQKGQLCGSIGEQNPELVQQYINNPLLLNGVKFEVRMHFVVASLNPLIIYAQDKAGVAFCALKYDSHDSQIQRHLCVYNIARELLNLSDEELFKISGKTREQFMSSFSYQHTLESLQKELEKEGSVPPGWVFNDFVPSVFRNYIHTILFSRHYLSPDSRLYEMYAPDILVNKDNMKPYILEYNTNPRMVNTSSFVHGWNLQTIKDIVLINMAQVRSRHFRIKNIIDEYVREYLDNKNPDRSEYMKRLIEANKNKIEPQFSVDKEITSYVKIYDESSSEDLYYNGNLIFDKECLH
ncbi:hypothetical protein ABPG74_013762 [Tetrahymena malaccensis]